MNKNNKKLQNIPKNIKDDGTIIEKGNDIKINFDQRSYLKL